MKRRLMSLVLALAMIMSLFTTVSFAAEGDGQTPETAKTGVTLAVENNLTEIVTSGQTKVTYALPNDALEHGGVVAEVKWTSSDATKATVATTGVVTGVAAGTANINCVVKVTTPEYTTGEGEDAVTTPAATTYYTSESPAAITVLANNYQLKLRKDNADAAAESKTLLPGGRYTPVVKVELWNKDATPAVVDAAPVVRYKSSNTTVATVVEATGVTTAVKSGTAYITAEYSYKGYTYSVQVATVTVNSLNIADKVITNGSSGTYVGSTLCTEVAAVVKKALGDNSTTYTTSELNITIPASAGGITFHAADGTAYTASSVVPLGNNATDKLLVKTTAGSIGSVTANYTATVNGSSYSGTITFKSDYAGTVTAAQTAPFFNEEFYMDAISTVTLLGAKNATSYLTSGATAVTSKLVSPSSHTTSWTEEYTGYYSSTNPVAYKVQVTFTPVAYDMVSYVEDGKTPFSANYFQTFANAVFAEQHPGYTSNYYSTYLDTVTIQNVKLTNKYTLYYGNTALTAGKALTPAQLETVTMDVIAGGAYEINFTASYKYKNASSSASTSYSTYPITGRVLVYAGNDGDIKYEVAYGEKVTFDSADFQALYRKLTNSRYNLTHLTVNALPLSGSLYKSARVSNAYAVAVGDTFYVTPGNSYNSYALDYLTYWASTSYTSEYSVYVPVTMYGTGTAVSAVVEIVVNGNIPFVDVAKNSTFYEYIRYCYNHEIMGGKSATRFDPSSNITRAQLVTTLYRMAGSPATYNSRTLPFADTKGLSVEFSNAIKWAYYNRIAGGTSATTFAPNAAVTRQAMVKILYGYAKAYGMDTGVIYNNHLGYYTDGGSVTASMQEAMNWAVDYQLMSGNGNKLNPRGNTTRGAAAKILANFHENFVD